MKHHLLILFIFSLLYSCKNEYKIPYEIIKKAEHELYDILQNGYRWEKVHAAEFLLNLGCDKSIYKTFCAESKLNGMTPEYRIGVWRILYRTSDPVEKNRWSDSIYRASVNPASPDKIHAVETLAKLKINKKNNRDDDTIDTMLKTADSRLKFYTQWWVTPQLPDGMNQLKKHLFHIIHSGEYENSIRSLAAYVIREDKSVLLNDEEWQTLKNTALSEPKESGNRILLLAAAFVKTPEKFSVSPAFKDIKHALSEYGNSNSQDLYSFCLAYADKGTTDDIKILTSLLDHEINDVRNAASYAILKINKRITNNTL